MKKTTQFSVVKPTLLVISVLLVFMWNNTTGIYYGNTNSVVAICSQKSEN